MLIKIRHAARVKNPWGQVVLGGNNVSPLVEIGLTDPPKSHLAACLIVQQEYNGKKKDDLDF